MDQFVWWINWILISTCTILHTYVGNGKLPQMKRFGGLVGSGRLTGSQSTVQREIVADFAVGLTSA